MTGSNSNFDLSAIHVSCIDKTITVECDDYDVRDRLMNFLTGGSSTSKECDAQQRSKEEPALLNLGFCRRDGDGFCRFCDVDEYGRPRPPLESK